MKILIVDDEKISRKILVNKLESIGECVETQSSEKALELLDEAEKNESPFDLMTLDVSMPKMDGRQVLKTIRQKEQKLKIDRKDRLKIIMVTSRMTMSTIKECIKLGCNGYLSKPVTKFQLIDNLERLGFARPEDAPGEEKESRVQILAKIINRFHRGKIAMPVLPGIAKEVRELIQGEDPFIEDLGKIIEKDIVMTSKLISIANSPLYKGFDKAGTLNAALLRLGLKATNGMVSTLVTKALFKSENKDLNALLEKLWMHSFACACFGKRIAEELENKNAETVFLMGIVHDIGKMLLLKAICDIDPEESISNEELLTSIHEIHTTFGAVVLKKMKFSDEFIKIAEFHHWNDFAGDEGQELLIIILSDFLAERSGYYFPGTPAAKEIEEEKKDSLEDIGELEALKQLGITQDRIGELFEEVKNLIKDSATTF